MRLYKLLRDTPTIKAGTMFREVVSDFDGARELARITPIGAKTSPQFTIQDIDNFDEWFEEIKEPVDGIHWKPKIGDRYWTSGNMGVYSQVWGDDEFDMDSNFVEVAKTQDDTYEFITWFYNGSTDLQEMLQKGLDQTRNSTEDVL